MTETSPTEIFSGGEKSVSKGLWAKPEADGMRRRSSAKRAVFVIGNVPSNRGAIIRFDPALIPWIQTNGLTILRRPTVQWIRVDRVQVRLSTRHWEDCPRSGGKSETGQISTGGNREHFVCLVAGDRSGLSDILVHEAPDATCSKHCPVKERPRQFTTGHMTTTSLGVDRVSGCVTGGRS